MHKVIQTSGAAYTDSMQASDMFLPLCNTAPHRTAQHSLLPYSTANTPGLTPAHLAANAMVQSELHRSLLKTVNMYERVRHGQLPDYAQKMFVALLWVSAAV
jgi:hypothetical protein